MVMNSGGDGGGGGSGVGAGFIQLTIVDFFLLPLSAPARGGLLSQLPSTLNTVGNLGEEVFVRTGVRYAVDSTEKRDVDIRVCVCVLCCVCIFAVCDLLWITW